MVKYALIRNGEYTGMVLTWKDVQNELEHAIHDDIRIFAVTMEWYWDPDTRLLYHDYDDSYNHSSIARTNKE